MRKLFVALALLLLPLADAGAAKTPTREQARGYCEVTVRNMVGVAFQFIQAGAPVEYTIESFREAARNKVPESIQASIVSMIRALYAGNEEAFMSAHEDAVRACTNTLTAVQA